MLTTRFATLITLFCLMSAPTYGKDAPPISIELAAGASYHVIENYLQRDNLELIRDLHFTKDRSYSLVTLSPLLSLRPAQWISLYAGGDVIWENPVEDESIDELDGQWTVAYLSLKGDRIQTDVGQQSIQFANGFILADDAPAAVINTSIGDGYAELKAAQVLDNSPMVGITLGYRPGYFEHVELFGIWFSDEDNVYSNSTPLVYQAIFDLSSEGDLYYAGASADLFLGNTLLSFTGAYQTGRFTLRRQDGNSADIDVEAYFGDVGLERNLSNWLTAGLFVYLASGDDTPMNRELDAFVTVNPYTPRAALFFDPEFLDIDNADRFTFGGNSVGGVIAPGVSLTCATETGLTAEASVIYLYAHQDLDDGSNWYGWEVDLTLSYTFAEDYRFYVEAARFEHGDYFESVLKEAVDPALRLLAGVQASF